MASEWTEIDYTTTLRRIPPQSVTLSVARTFPVDVDECHPIDAKPRLAGGGEDIATSKAHDFRRRRPVPRAKLNATWSRGWAGVTASRVDYSVRVSVRRLSRRLLKKRHLA